MSAKNQARFIAPNVFTLGNLFCGYLSIISAFKGKIDLACQLILLGALFDYVDGLVARKLNSQSRFGFEFDSIADSLTFGVAPSTVLYFLLSKLDYDQIPVVIGFIYSAAVAIRLARFNSSDVGLIHFRGLPSPAAAITLASFFQITSTLENKMFLLFSVSIFTTFIAFLLISKIVFISLKGDTRLSLRQKFLIAIALGVVYYLGWVGVFGVMILYVISGPILFIVRLFRLSSKL